MDYEKLRHRMVQRQLMARGIRDSRVLEAMGKVPRERFVPDALKSQAYDDNPLPIGEDQTISQPYIVAQMTEALKTEGKENVLEIGTGSGYQAAVLAVLVGRVYTVERFSLHSKRARETLGLLGYSNIHFMVGDGTLGWEENAPYDGIIVTAAAPKAPAPLYDQLAEGGRMVIPVGDRMGQDLIRIVKEKGEFLEKHLGAARFVSLVGQYGWKE